MVSIMNINNGINRTYPKISKQYQSKLMLCRYLKVKESFYTHGIFKVNTIFLQQYWYKGSFSRYEGSHTVYRIEW